MLSPRYTFSTFIMGKSNQLAHAASLAVAENPGKVLQSPVLLRRRGTGQDPPVARHRTHGRGLRLKCAVRDLGKIYQRNHQRYPLSKNRRISH